MNYRYVAFAIFLGLPGTILPMLMTDTYYTDNHWQGRPQDLPKSSRLEQVKKVALLSAQVLKKISSNLKKLDAVGDDYQARATCLQTALNLLGCQTFLRDFYTFRIKGETWKREASVQKTHDLGSLGSFQEIVCSEMIKQLQSLSARVSEKMFEEIDRLDSAGASKDLERLLSEFFKSQKFLQDTYAPVINAELRREEYKEVSAGWVRSPNHAIQSILNLLRVRKLLVEEIAGALPKELDEYLGQRITTAPLDLWGKQSDCFILEGLQNGDTMYHWVFDNIPEVYRFFFLDTMARFMPNSGVTDINKQNDQGMCPLAYAIHKKDKVALFCLLKHSQHISFAGDDVRSQGLIDAYFAFDLLKGSVGRLDHAAFLRYLKTCGTSEEVLQPYSVSGGI